MIFRTTSNAVWVQFRNLKVKKIVDKKDDVVFHWKLVKTQKVVTAIRQISTIWHSAERFTLVRVKFNDVRIKLYYFHFKNNNQPIRIIVTNLAVTLFL